MKIISSTKCNIVNLFFRPAGFSTAVNAISGNSTIQISDEEKKRILDEENQRLQQLKVFYVNQEDITKQKVIIFVRILDHLILRSVFLASNSYIRQSVNIGIQIMG